MWHSSLHIARGICHRHRVHQLLHCHYKLQMQDVYKRQLQTHEINVSELQTARQLSRLLDGVYNTPAWQALTRELILNDEQFLHRFLTYLTKANLTINLIRGLILFQYRFHFPYDSTIHQVFI